ncbi:hypothetical protein PTKIN_Ptkin02bG0111900 [Pterospermum kingtungense]
MTYTTPPPPAYMYSYVPQFIGQSPSQMPSMPNLGVSPSNLVDVPDLDDPKEREKLQKNVVASLDSSEMQ